MTVGCREMLDGAWLNVDRKIGLAWRAFSHLKVCDVAVRGEERLGLIYQVGRYPGPEYYRLDRCLR